MASGTDVTRENFDLEITPTGRTPLAMDALLEQLSAAFSVCEGCEKVRVVRVTRMDPPDSSGCNWSSSLVLDPGGAMPEVYGRAYADVMTSARSLWNLK